MANPHRGEVEIDLAGMTLTLRPTYEAIIEIEERTGRPLVGILRALVAGDLRHRDLAIIIHAGARAFDAKAPALGAIGAALVREGLSPALMTSITDFLAAALGGTAVKEKNGGEAADVDPTAAA